MSSLYCLYLSCSLQHSPSFSFYMIHARLLLIEFADSRHLCIAGDLFLCSLLLYGLFGLHAPDGSHELHIRGKQENCNRSKNMTIIIQDGFHTCKLKLEPYGLKYYYKGYLYQMAVKSDYRAEKLACRQAAHRSTQAQILVFFYVCGFGGYQSFHRSQRLIVQFLLSFSYNRIFFSASQMSYFQLVINSLQFNNTRRIQFGVLSAFLTHVDLSMRELSTLELEGCVEQQWTAAQLIQQSCMHESMSICSWCCSHMTQGRISQSDIQTTVLSI